MEPESGSPLAARVGAPRYGGMWEAEAEGLRQRYAVPFVIEGERVRIAPRTDLPVQRGGLPEANLEVVLASDENRTSPGCRHFGVCGGCQYQHLHADAETRLKARILRDLFADARIPLPFSGVRLHAAAEYGYRNRARLRIEAQQLGYSRRATHLFLPIEECPILSPLLQRTLETLRAGLKGGLQLPASTMEVELFASSTEDSLQIALHLNEAVNTLGRDAPAQFRSFCQALRDQLPELAGGGLLVQAAADPGISKRVSERLRIEVAHWGMRGLHHRVAGRSYEVSRGAFFQVNRHLTSLMVELATRGRGGQLAFDLYAGAGLFSCALAESFAELIAVEVGEPAASDLARTMREIAPQAHVEHTTTLDFLQRWKRERRSRQPSLVVLDPPRAGLGAPVVRALVAVAPEEIVYVSCDPTTLLRDAAPLLKSGYAVEELHLLNLFPQTFHMETITVFRRGVR